MPSAKKTAKKGVKKAAKRASKPVSRTDSEGSQTASQASPNVAQSMQAASGMSGYSLDALKRAKAEGCPAFRGPRVYLDELDRWLADNSHVLGLGPVDRLEFESKQLKKEREQFNLDVTRGDYIARSEIADHVQRTEADTKTLLRRFLFSELPAKGEHCDRAALRELCENIFERICNERQKRLSKWTRD